MKQPASNLKKVDSLSLGCLRRTSTEEKSYIQTWDDERGTWRNLANITSRFAANHEAIAIKMLMIAQDNNMGERTFANLKHTLAKEEDPKSYSFSATDALAEDEADEADEAEETDLQDEDD